MVALRGGQSMLNTDKDVDRCMNKRRRRRR